VRVLVVNSGSSSLKLTLLASDDEILAHRELAAPEGGVDPRELDTALGDGLGDADAVGHRIVHGGERFDAATLLDAEVIGELRELIELAPLHQSRSLAALDAVSASLPGVSAVACFDTSFHAGLPRAARTYALPAGWTARWRLRRFGFHGLSHAWVARRAGELLAPSGSELRLVSAHLGAGASLCAIASGRSIDTTMGFTPLEGLVMATRSGTVDPGLLLWLLEHAGLSERAISHSLEHEAGLLGLAGAADMRIVLARAAAGDDDAALALDVYLHRLRSGIAAMAASLGGVDAVAFTGGVGENSPAIRSRAVERLAFVGLAIDERRNAGAAGDGDLSTPDARVRTLVIRAREDLEIARQVRALLGCEAQGVHR
jgi:acetate kinase